MGTVKRVAFVGFGSLGQRAIHILSGKGQSLEPVYFDDHLYAEALPNAFPFERHVDPLFSDRVFYICLGYKHLALKNALIENLKRLGREQGNIIHPEAKIDYGAVLGVGNFISCGAVIAEGASLSDGIYLGAGTIVSHHCKLASCVYCGPGAILSGNVCVEERVFIGAGAVLAHDLHIGRDSKIALGAVLRSNVPANSSMLGAPARLGRGAIHLI